MNEPGDRDGALENSAPRGRRAATFDLIAHRGDARRRPENTIEAFRSALDGGARYIELDVHVSADGVPVVHHDETLRRTTGEDGRVWERSVEELGALDAGERARFGDRFAGTRIPRLDRVAEFLAAEPDVFTFVELKRASLDHFGAERVVERCLAALAPIEDRFAIISFAREPLHAARAAGVHIGWVIDRYDDAARGDAIDLAPQFLFADHRLLGSDGSPLWPGPWRWAIYEVIDADLARSLAARGAALIETMAIADMLGAP